MIRAAIESDIPRLVEMGTRFVAETVYRDRGLVIDPAAATRTLTLLIASDIGVLLVAELEGQLVGMIGLLAFEHPFSGASEAHELFWWVEPEHRGLGVRLLKRAEQWAAAMGVQHVNMIAPTKEVEELYARLGYGYVEAGYQKAIDVDL